ncbi:MAG: hypothetical protein JXA97_11185 [Anaerolineales bacterium]|nr:hypothetical protein [Anaerolineales bacterium]
MLKPRPFFIVTALLIGMVLLAGCGGDASATAPPAQVEAAQPEAAVEPVQEVAAPVEEDTPAPAQDAAPDPFVIFNPYDGLTEEDILFLEADGFTGTDKEIADAILAWQAAHMFYIGDPNQQPDISHPMRWNYMLPGIFPVGDMVRERRLDNGLIYGLCWDYAAIYNAIANYYGLEVRVTANKVYISEQNPNIDPTTAHGMSPMEFEALQPRLQAAGLDLSYDQISRAARETWAHYRAEVRLGDEWVAYDGVPGVAAGPTYEVAPWDEGYDAELLYAEFSYGDDAIDLAGMAVALANAPADGYEGVTDDAGDTHRAASMEDLCTGQGLVPYYNTSEDVLAFLHIVDMPGGFDEYADLMTEYEAGTGKPFYIIADIMIYTEDEIAAEDYVPLYNALTGSDMTMEEFEEYVQ